MTGYAIGTKKYSQGTLNLELRSVNHRYLDIQLRLPEKFRLLEPSIREIITSKLNRGKIECYVSFNRLSDKEDEQKINIELLQELLELNNTIRTALPDARNLSVADIIRWPNMLKTEILPTDDLCDLCKELLQNTLYELKSTRAREGEKLKTILLERLASMRQLTTTAAPLIPALVASYQEKLSTKLNDALITSGDDRIRQELVIFASKIDIDEEICRLETHFDEIERILNKGGVVGKRLDFLMQELNREANTIGSKSVASDISKISLELKILIEQMREQIQNIE
tara:strand:+ start:1387 stop:2241 length:855 start_codon:yes stop_codon:yes gene_type:complete